jgi:hypothetical protein
MEIDGRVTEKHGPTLSPSRLGAAHGDPHKRSVPERKSRSRAAVAGDERALTEASP